MPDASHSWSMATPIEADVRLDSRINGMATFYTTAPESPECKVLGSAEIVNGRGSKRFDVRYDTDMVYVRVAGSNGVTEFSGFVTSNDGHVTVTNSASRAGDCPVTKEPTEWKYKRVSEKGLKAASRFIAEHPDDYMTKTWSDIIDASKAYGQDDQIYSTEKVDMQVQNLHKLNGRPERSWTVPFAWSEIQAIIDNYFVGDKAKPAVFSESYNNKYKDNIRKFYQKPEEGGPKLDAHNSTIVEMDGPVTLDLMWRGAHQQKYIFGYYYFTEEDYGSMLADPGAFFDKVPKFIIYDPDDPELHIAGDNSIFQIRSCERNEHHYRIHDLGTDSEKAEGKENDPCYQSGEHKVQDNWENLIGNVCNAVKDQQNFMRGSILRGEVIKLAYFGKDGKDDDATYDFPKGTRIGFFGANVTKVESFFCSDAVLGFYLFNRTYTQGGFSPAEKVPGHYPKVARFRVAGSDYMGVELEEDNDLNDLVFRIRNVEPAPDITPQDFPTNTDPDPEEWIIACEDLGSTEDYDFNDVVLKVGVIPAKEGGKAQVKITPIACGGTLNSYVSFRENSLGEIHNLLGMPQKYAAGAGNGTPDINHSNVPPMYYDVEDGYLLSEKYSQDFTVTTTWRNGEDIKSHWIDKVMDGKNGNAALEAPQMLLLHPDWSWPVENRGIIDAYPDFRSWIHDINNYDWIKNTPTHHTYTIE